MRKSPWVITIKVMALNARSSNSVVGRAVEHLGLPGEATLNVMEEAIYRAREGPLVDLSVALQRRLEAFRAVCEQHHDAAHEKTRALAREFLNDWEAIWRVLAHPHLPLTNNEAEVRFVDPKPDLNKVWEMGPESKIGDSL